MIKTYSPPLKFYTDQIENGSPFSFIRYGDGEWSAILGDRSRTSSGSHTLRLPVLRRDLSDSLTKPRRADNCYYSLRETSINERAGRRGKQASHWLKQNTRKIRWHNCTILYQSSRKGQLYPFIRSLRNSPLPVVVVGPKRLRALSPSVFEFAHFVEIPNRDAYVMKTPIIKRVLEVETPALFLFVAGPAAKALIYKLFKPLGETCTMIDCGSLWDIYVGKKTRQYHRRMKPETIKRNITGP